MAKSMRVVPTLSICLLFVAFSAHAGKLFWSDEDPLRRIARADLDGSVVESLFVGPSASAWALTADVGSRKVFWTTLGDVWSANLDGSQPLKIRDDSNWFGFEVEFDLFNDRLYWTSYSGDRIERIDVDGSNYQVILSGRDEPAGLALDAGQGKMYWAELGDTNTLFRADLDGTDVEVVLAAVQARNLEIDDASGKLYWITPGVSIQRANLGGTNVETIVGDGTLVGLYLKLDTVHGHLYWTDDDSRIHRSDLDGANIVTVVDGLEDLRPIAVVPVTFCDDGGNDDDDGCQGNCILPICGDGIVDAGEQCDDANDLDFDGCQSDCSPSPDDPDSKFEWAGSFSQSGWFGSRLAVDSAGITTVVLCFQGSIDADPGPGVLTVVSDGGMRNTLVVRIDPDGELLSAGLLTGDDVCARDVVADDLGNTYLAGYFENVADVDPGPGVVALSTGIVADAFAVKLAPDGSLIWASQTSGGGALLGATAFGGNLFGVGFAASGSDIDPGPASQALPHGGAFVWALGAAGELLWARNLSDASSGVGVEAIASSVDSIVATGRFYGSIDFDPGPGTIALPGGCGSIYVTSMQPADGTLKWVRGALVPDCTGDTAPNTYPSGIDIDDLGRIYIGGSYGGAVDFDPGPGSQIYDSGDFGDSNAFLWSLDALGNFRWLRQMDSMGSFPSAGVAAVGVDELGGIYTTGDFRDSIVLAPGLILNAVGADDAFIVKYDAAGGVIWSGTFGGPLEVAGNDLDARAPSVYLTGRFEGIADFDPGEGIANREAVGEFGDAYVVRLTPIDGPPVPALGALAALVLLLTMLGVAALLRR